MSTSRLSISAVIAAVAMLCASSAVVAQQQTYRWVDEHGHVTYSDRPPPPGAVEVEERGGTSDTAVPAEAAPATALSMEAAAAQSPVTLFAIDDCDACDLVRMYLRNRGVPFADLDVEGDTTAQGRLEGLVGRLEVPTVSVGAQVLSGYSRSALDIALRNAGYPEGSAVSPEVTTPSPAAAEPALDEEPVIPDDLLDDLPGS